MVTDYRGDDHTGTCGGKKANGKPCTRRVKFTVKKPYSDPMFDLTPFCPDHRDQEPELDPGMTEDWTKTEGF